MPRHNRIPLLAAVLVALLLVAAITAVVVKSGSDGDRRAGPSTVAEPTPAPTPRTCAAIEQHGVTFTFDGDHFCGEFANGDAWVAPAAADPVVITDVQPAAAQGRNGWMVNPESRGDQAYDDRVGGYEPTLLPTLPYEAKEDESVIKAVSASGKCGNGEGHPSCLQSATVLTVLAEPPTDLGATVFRPPYFGVQKPLISTTDIRTDLLPELEPVETSLTLEDVQKRYARVQLDHKSNWQGRYLHPAENFRSFDGDEVSNYGADLARDNNDAALRLMLDDSIDDKMPALINYLQAGIDWYGTGLGGVDYTASGGQNVGRKVVVTFAAVLLDHADMKAVAGRDDPDAYSENGHVYLSPQTQQPLFGRKCSDGEYEKVLNDGQGARDCRDPLGVIDGGEVPGGAYQSCCTAKPYQGASLVARLLPGGEKVWNADHFHDYVDRWVEAGAVTSPDPRGRFPDRHGEAADSGSYGSSFMRAMWDAYAEAAA